MTRLPRVLVIEPQSSGGMWHYAYSLCRALSAAGWETTLATIFPFEHLGDSDRFRVVSMGSHVSLASRGPLFLLRRGVSHVDKLMRLRRIVVEYPPAIVHLHNSLGRLDFAYFKVLKALGMRVVYTAHDARPLGGNGGWFDRARYREADAIFVHSSNGVEELVADGVDPSKIILIPHGNYLHFSEGANLSAGQAKHLLGLPVDARAVLFFGTVASYKGLDILINAFSLLRQEVPGAYLIIAGEPLEDFTPYLHQLKQAGVSDRVILDLRYIPFAEFSKYFTGSDLVVFPYRRIYQSGVLQLAYAYGRPVVVTNVGGVAEAVLEDRTGIVARTADAVGLAEAMRRLLSDPVEASLMGSRGRRLAETKYSWGSITRRIVDVYLRLRDASAMGAERRRGTLHK